MKTKSIYLYTITMGALLASSAGAPAQSKLFIRDDISDVGNQPNNESTYFYISDDLWVRRTGDPNYDPTPFPTASPPWTPQPHEDPCYRDPKTSSPNFIYVRIRNIGDAASSGTEVLHVYWAKASAGWANYWGTGVAGDCNWIDHLRTPTCGGPAKLYGYEVTKPRKNGATASGPEKSAYVAAIQAINNGTVTYEYSDGVTYFNKQNVIHGGLVNVANNIIHNVAGFLPWHREFVNRYEVLLRESNPVLTLLYWDWTTDPSATGPITGASGYFGGDTGAVGAPFPPGSPPNFGSIVRNKGPGLPGSCYSGLSVATQNSLQLRTDFRTFWGDQVTPPTPYGIESLSHNSAHVYIGGFSGHPTVSCQRPEGTMSDPTTAAGDPIFFMLHANCDRLWAKWQRRNSASLPTGPNADLATDQWAPARAYTPLRSDPTITGEMRPWNGGGILSGSLTPWTGANVTHKTPLSHSVIYPPIYDDTLLKIPAIPANNCCIIEVPFYPPPLTECPGFVDPSHLCLLARIEPVGITEGTDLGTNVKGSRRIAWRNIGLADCSGPGPWFALLDGRIGMPGELIGNPRLNDAILRLRFDTQKVGTDTLFDFGLVRLRLETNLYQAWLNGGMLGTNVVDVGTNNEVFVLGPGAELSGLRLAANEVGHMDLALELNPNYRPPDGKIFYLDLLQFDEQTGTNALGGQRYTLDFNLLSLVQKRTVWRYLDGGQIPPNAWTKTNYDDSLWQTGRANFGYGRPDVETSLVGTNNSPPTAYFRQNFTVVTPTFYRSLHLNVVQDDGLVAYLNGFEIARLNMPTGTIFPATPASSPTTGAASRAYRTIDVSNALSLLVPGTNVLAVEVHPATNGSPRDLTFDLHLAANVPTNPYQPPTVVVTSPTYGGSYRLGSNVPITADVFAPDGNLSQVRIYTNNVLLSTQTNPPFSALFLQPRAGGNRVSVEAQDLVGHVTRMESLFTVVSNLLPTATFITPTNDPVFPSGAAVPLAVNASDLDGSVTQVVFYVLNHRDVYTSTPLQVGLKTTPPYSVAALNLRPGHYAAYAAATDNQGEVGLAYPAHFYISQPIGTPPLRISMQQPGTAAPVAVLDWDDLTAVLESSSKITGPWAPQIGAAPPYYFDARVAGSQFFRLRFQ